MTQERAASYFRNPEVLWREEPEPETRAQEALARGEDAGDIVTSLLLWRGKLVSLNLLGTEIWKMCDGRDVDAMVTSLAADFEVGEAELRHDVAAFLASLVEQGLVHER